MEQVKSKPLSPFIFIPLLLLIFIRPLLSGLAYPVLEIYYENCVIFLAIISLLFSYPFRGEGKGEGKSKKPSYALPILLLLLAYLISSITSIDVQSSIGETIKFVSYVCTFFLVLQADERQKKAILRLIVLTASIISIYSIYQYFWGYERVLNFVQRMYSDFLSSSSYARDILISKRTIGTFPSPNILGGYLAMAFFLVLSLPRERFALIAIAIALVLTKSIGAWFSFIITLAIWAFISFDSFKKRKRISIISLSLISIAVIFVLVSRWDRLANLGGPQNSITQRLEYWQTATGMIKDHPVVGVGPGNFQQAFLKYKTDLKSADPKYAHNIFLHMWAETGTLGLIGIIFLVLVFFRRYKANCKFIFLAGSAFILHNLIDSTYFIPEVGMFWWVILGLTLRFNVGEACATKRYVKLNM